MNELYQLVIGNSTTDLEKVFMIAVFYMALEGLFTVIAELIKTGRR